MAVGFAELLIVLALVMYVPMPHLMVFACLPLAAILLL